MYRALNSLDFPLTFGLLNDVSVNIFHHIAYKIKTTTAACPFLPVKTLCFLMILGYILCFSFAQKTSSHSRYKKTTKCRATVSFPA